MVGSGLTAAIPFSESFVDWLWISGGVVLAVVWPRLRKAVVAVFGVQTAAAGEDVRKALLLVAFAASTAIIVLAVTRAARPNEHLLWYACLLGGFGWESTFEKLTGLTTSRG